MILITGATGTVGRPLTGVVNAAGAEVRAISRDPATARLPAGVEVVAGDPTRPETIARALSGATAVFINPAAVGTAAGDLLALARDRGVRRVVLLSALVVDDPAQRDNPLATYHRAIETAVTASGMEWVVLRPGMFAANTITEWAAQIRAGDIVHGAYGGATTAPLHEGDLAQVAGRALLDTGLTGRYIPMTGPESLTRAQLVTTIGRVIGRPLRYEQVPPERAAAAMAGHGVPEAMARTMLSMWAAAVGRPAMLSDGVPAVLGRPAHTFAEWVAEHTAAFTAHPAPRTLAKEATP